MMRASKILTRFSKLPESSLAILARTVFTSMTGNVNFPAPVPTLAALATAITAYTTALANAKTGGELETAIKAQKRKDLEDILYNLALYVTQASNADETKLLGSGFKISKHPAPVGPLPKPENFNVVPGGKGEMKLKIKRLVGASSYQWEYKQVDTPQWTNTMDTKSKILLVGLESGKEYEFRVLPVGASDIREYSDVISSFVL